MSARIPARSRPRLLLATFAGSVLAITLSCTENLPTGPTVFPSGSLKITVAHDTIVVGDSSVATAVATDQSGNVIQSLKFSWTTSNAAIVELAAGTSEDGLAGRTQTLIGRRTGVSTVSAALPDPRFNASAASRTTTVVVGGVRVLSSKDTTLTAINDTGRAIATGLVRVNGALVPRVSQGIRWTHKGTRTDVIGSGDTIRYIARSNGADTLIATADFCLVGAKCADTAIVRVAQQLTLTLSGKSFTSWSFGDTLGPIATLADRRGTGLAGTTIRLIPVTAADSAIVRVTAPLGVSNPATGLVASPRLVSIGNGFARVVVGAYGPDGSLIASDEITETVRQVARRVAVEPLRATMSVVDSIPIRPVARDARGFPIADATITLSQINAAVRDGIWVGPVGVALIGEQATITPFLSGVAAPENNKGAPQFPVVVDPSVISLTKVDTVKANAAIVNYTIIAVDSGLTPAANTWIRFRASSGASPDSVLTNSSGVATVQWNLRTQAGLYTLTGVRSAPSLATLADSAGRILLRRTVQVVAAAPEPTQTILSMSAATIATNATATIQVNVFDAFGNLVRDATPSLFDAFFATRGTITGLSCDQGVCTATYKAPATTGADAVTVTIGGVPIAFSPFQLVIN